ncbi:hypothetical protein B5M09_001698 [Aphanomyces astaci]|uniref:IBB domain-containing protein n=1 Tax=Aphanomyces astaci TaxID=112090 RepID=A0A425D677_APHAT|nr:hypothetical protein B5M09_001698 [Aphanomyces astaci]
MASGTSDQTRLVVECDAVPLLVRPVMSMNDKICDQVMWAGNIAGDSSVLRDFVLEAGGMLPLLHQIYSDEVSTSMLKNATWVLGNFCRGTPRPRFELVRPALSTLSHLLSSNDPNVVADACWALSYLSDGPTNSIQNVLDTTGIVPRLIQLLAHKDKDVVYPVVRTLGNMMTAGMDVQVQTLIDQGMLPRLLPLFHIRKENIGEGECGTVRTLSAGSMPHIQAIVDAHIVPPMVGLLTTGQFNMQKEAAWLTLLL